MLKKLLERLEALKTEARTLLDKAITESRALNEVESKRKGEIEGELKTVNSQIETYRSLGLDVPATPPTPPTPPAANRDGTPTPEGRMTAPNIQVPTKPRYRLLRALALAAAGRSLDGFEGEVNQEIAKRTGKSPQGFFLPYDFESPLESRDLNLTTGSGVKPTIVDAGSFIDLLRNKTLVRSLGATVLTGLTGDLSIPKQTAASTAYWFASESTDVTESNQTISQVGLAPKTLGAFTDISRKFLLQSSIDAEQFVRNDLAAVLALELDRACINGSGNGAEPKGILQESTITTVPMGNNGLAPTWANLVALESTVAAVNADVGSLAYLTNALVRGKLKTVVKAANTAEFLWDSRSPGTPVNGYNCGVSNQVPSTLTKGTSDSVCSAIIFGDWASVLIGLWGAVDVLVDPYSGGLSGAIRIRLLQDADIKFRRTESFAKCVDYLTA